MRGTATKGALLVGLILMLAAGGSRAQAAGNKDYLQDCAECHGADGKGAQSEKRAIARLYLDRPDPNQ